MKEKLIELKGVKISFNNIYTSKDVFGKQKYTANFIIHKDDKVNIAKISNALNEIIKTELDSKKLTHDNLCYKKGDETGWKDYKDSMYIISSSINKPNLFKNGIIMSDQSISMNDKVDVILKLWLQNNEFEGKKITKIHAELKSVSININTDDFSSLFNQDDNLF